MSSLMCLIALPIDTLSGLHSTRKLTSVLNSCVRSRFRLLPSGVL